MNYPHTSRSKSRAVWALLSGVSFALLLMTSMSAAAPTAPAAPPAQPVGILEAPEAAEPEAASDGLTDMSSILGPDSQLDAAEDGEFEFNIGEDGAFSDFRALKGVSLVTEDFDLTCHELIYKATAGGSLLATAETKGIVTIAMRSLSPTSTGDSAGSKGDTRATCGRYEYNIKEQRHILRNNPVIYRKDATGKTTVVSGKLITITQDVKGRLHMLVEGRPGIHPLGKKKTAIERSRERTGSEKPNLSIDTNDLPAEKAAAPAQPGSTVVPGVAAPVVPAAPRPVKIDDGNLETLKKPKSSSLLKIEERG